MLRGKLRLAHLVHAYYAKVAAELRTSVLQLSPLVGARIVSPMVLGMYLSFLPYSCVCEQPLLYGGEYCCALCPFRLTYQRFGIVWEARDLVGLMW